MAKTVKKESEKKKSTTVSFRPSAEIKAKLLAKAKARKRSIAYIVNEYITAAVK